MNETKPSPNFDSHCNDVTVPASNVEDLKGSDSGESVPAPFPPQPPFSFFLGETSIAQFKVQIPKNSIDKCYRPIPFSFKNFAFKSKQIFEIPKNVKDSLFSKFATGKFSNKKTIRSD